MEQLLILLADAGRAAEIALLNWSQLLPSCYSAVMRIIHVTIPAAQRMDCNIGLSHLFGSVVWTSAGGNDFVGQSSYFQATTFYLGISSCGKSGVECTLKAKVLPQETTHLI